MVNSFAAIGIVILYLAALFAVAYFVEKKRVNGKNPANNPFIYSLSLTVYFTSWSLYGNVGLAASSGYSALLLGIGVTLSVFTWWTLLRKMIRIKNIYHITSIADFISTRYNKSGSIAALVTGLTIFGFVPYVSLQLKSIFSTFDIIVGSNVLQAGATGTFGFKMLIILLLIVFANILGVRKLVPTERHQGVVTILAVDAIVKLIAIVSIGIFVTFFLFNGFDDILNQAIGKQLLNPPDSTSGSTTGFLYWISVLLLSMMSILCLPRQFHVSVIENFDEKQVKTAFWLFPLYAFLLTLFVLPIAMGGLLTGYPVQSADTFILRIPFDAGHSWLSVFVFLGGLSASFCMVMLSSMTISIMFSNHIMLPVIEWLPRLHFLKKYLLQCRWFAVALFILLAYWFESSFGSRYMLSDMGLIAFIAVAQFAPAMLLGMFWKRGNAKGAQMGLSAGFILWFYTLIIPILCNAGILSQSWLTSGPLGIKFLSPDQLFGFTGINLISHGMFWSLFFNIVLYLAGSLLTKQDAEEVKMAGSFVNVLKSDTPQEIIIPGKPQIELETKREIIEKIFLQFFSSKEANEMAAKCIESVNLKEKQLISVIELSKLQNAVENCLTASIGSSAAHHIVKKNSLFTKENEDELKNAYTDIITDYKLPPSELLQKIDYYVEKENLLLKHACELEEKVKELEFRNLLFTTQQEASIDGILIVDEEGKILSYNSVFLDIWNLLPKMMESGMDDIVLKSVTNTVAEPEAFIKEVNRIYKGTSISRNMEIKLKDGRILERSSFPMIGAKGKYYGRVWYFRDITERKKIEAALIASEKKYSKVFRYAGDIIGIVRASDNKFVEINESFRTTFGYDYDEVVGHSSSEFGLWVNRGQREKSIEIIAENKSVRNFEVQWRCKSGEIRYGLIANELVDINGELCYVFVFQDVTERKHAMEEIKKLNAELELRVQKRTAELEIANKDLEAFAYSVSHDLRAPLRAIVGFSTFLQEDFYDLLDETGRGYIDRLQKSAIYMGELIDDMMLLSRVKKSEITYSDFSLSELARSIAGDLKSAEPQRVVKMSIAEGMTVHADINLMKIAMTNLINNAWKYTSKRSIAEIEIGVQDIDGKHVFYIQDNGSGFNMKYYEKLFLPFKRLHSSTEFNGTGVGLATVQRIIQRHGGEIWAEAEEDKGAVFYFTIPSAKDN
jgi:PAS domain S-box-containing protein